jgi:hypothetical protein
MQIAMVQGMSVKCREQHAMIEVEVLVGKCNEVVDVTGDANAQATGAENANASLLGANRR